MDELYIFEEADIRITRTQVHVEDHVFMTDTIHAVDLKEVKPKRQFSIVSILVGAMMLMDDGALFAVGCVAVSLGILSILASRNRYSVTLMEPHRLVHVLLTHDRLLAYRVFEAISLVVPREAELTIHIGKNSAIGNLAS